MNGIYRWALHPFFTLGSGGAFWSSVERKY
jgi:hypothetical protein